MTVVAHGKLQCILTQAYTPTVVKFVMHVRMGVCECLHQRQLAFRRCMWIALRLRARLAALRFREVFAAFHFAGTLTSLAV